MVEGARLERVYAGNRIKGSNPFLSANFFHTTSGFKLVHRVTRLPPACVERPTGIRIIPSSDHPM